VVGILCQLVQEREEGGRLTDEKPHIRQERNNTHGNAPPFESVE